MGASKAVAGKVMFGLVHVMSGGGVTPIAQQVAGGNPDAILINAREAATVGARMGLLHEELHASTDKLASKYWCGGTATERAEGQLREIRGCLGELRRQQHALNTQMTQASQQIGELQNLILRTIGLGNARVASILAGGPWALPAAKASAVATVASSVRYLRLFQQVFKTLGAVLGTIASDANGTTAKMGAVFDRVGDGFGVAADGAAPGSGQFGVAGWPYGTPPTFPTGTPTYPGPYQLPGVGGSPGGTIYPSQPGYPQPGYPQPSYPQPGYPAEPAYPTYPASPGQQAYPTVYGPSGGTGGWIPAAPAGGTTGGTTGGESVTITVEDANGDGRPEIKVQLPEDKLDKDVKITVSGELDGKKFTETIDIDAR